MTRVALSWIVHGVPTSVSNSRPFWKNSAVKCGKLINWCKVRAGVSNCHLNNATVMLGPELSGTFYFSY